jgi:integrase/recombinase XerD
MDPDRDWSWIYRMYSQIRFRHRPARPKRSRLVSAGELFDLGIGLMAATEHKRTVCARALAHRDGLILALLAARPLRLRNLAGLALDRTLVSRGTQWWIEIPAGETKTKKQPIELPWPAALVGHLETYLAQHRGVLAGLRRGSTEPLGGALWLSKKGMPMDRSTMYACVTARTRNVLGRPINPHLFRDCVATSIAIEDPRHIGIAWCLLGHQTALTTEKYYNQARSVEASQRWQNALLSLREQSVL